MVEEVLAALQVRSGGLYVDCTTGEGAEYDYVEKYLTLTAPRLLLVDLSIIMKGIKVLLAGKGL